jgi:hypothetical protein
MAMNSKGIPSYAMHTHVSDDPLIFQHLETSPTTIQRAGSPQQNNFLAQKPIPLGAYASNGI